MKLSYREITTLLKMLEVCYMNATTEKRKAFYRKLSHKLNHEYIEKVFHEGVYKDEQKKS